MWVLTVVQDFESFDPILLIKMVFDLYYMLILLGSDRREKQETKEMQWCPERSWRREAA
jgi:hypothetical protein